MLALESAKRVMMRQIFKRRELVGFEARNMYELFDEDNQYLGYAAEEGGGFLGGLLRYFLGHWRKFNIHCFDAANQEVMIVHHPFCLFFQRLVVMTPEGKRLGIIQQRMSILSKKFEVQTANGMTLFQMSSPIWKIWSFPFYRRNREIARISKKWSGLLSEAFTDRDDFMLEFKDSNVTNSQRQLILAAALFVDLQYFEKHAGG